MTETDPGVASVDSFCEWSQPRAVPQVSSAALAAQLVGELTSPSRAAIKVEMKLRLEEVLHKMNDVDREILVLRHFEQMSNTETAQALGIRASAACKRYVRALEKLKRIHSSMDEEQV